MSTGSAPPEDDGASAAARRSAIEEALEDVESSSDWYHWARQAGLYITREELLDRQAAAEKVVSPLQAAGDIGQVVIVDTRDDDCVGGMIRGAVHMADSTFTSSSIEALLLAADTTLLVFHCMESARWIARESVSTQNIHSVAGAGPDALAGCTWRCNRCNKAAGRSQT